jgi:glycosyltransferase involved in cell wall biosynthesis
MSTWIGKGYFDHIRDLVERRGQGLSSSLLAKYEEELTSLFVNDIGKILPDVHAELSGEFVSRIRQRIPMAGAKAKIVLMPAGGFAVWLGSRLRDAATEVVAFLDNYQEERACPDGTRVLRPEKARDLQFDCILLATPSVRAQTAMRVQLEEILGSQSTIIVTADIALAIKIERIDAISEARADLVAEKIRGIRQTGKGKKLLFALPSFPAHYLHTVRAFRKKGHAVVLLSHAPDIMYGPKVSEYASEFDHIHSCDNNHLEFLKIVSKARADVLFTVDHTLYNHFALLIRDLWRGKMFFEVYDLSDNVCLPKGSGVRVLESTLGIDSRGLEDCARGVLYSSVDGIIYRDSPELLERARRIYGFSTRALQFFPYPEPYDKLKEVDGRDHVVFCGHIPNVKTELVYTVLPLAKEVASQQIHMHIYNPCDPDRCLLPEYIEADEQDQYIHYHKAVPFDALIFLMRQYDWGWLVYDFAGMPEEVLIQNEHTFTSRILAYVAAGLPMICSEENTYQAELINRYGIGVIVARNDIKDIAEILQNVDYEAMRQNTLRLRDDWRMSRKFNELLEFIE